MNNHILHVDTNFNIDDLKTSGYYFAEIDGRTISSKLELLQALKEKFKLPDANNWDAVADWLSDLDWLGKEGYILCVTNFAELLKDDLASKRIFLEILSDTIEWWDGDVEKYVVDGKKKPFNVYLVDEE